ncbi:MAG: hypothetical protein WAM69_00190 [Candidatus Sulfotelmatobacter sp.]
MNHELKIKIENNLFPLARPAVEPWDKFPWHLDRSNLCDTWKIHSSQALAIDVFGTLMMLAQPSRDAIFDSICKMLNVPPGGPWQVHLEWSDPNNLLKEPRPTQIDAAVMGRFASILFEVKFTERQAGCCSQTQHLARVGQAQCNGNFELQVNPANQILDRCALTGKGIRYWEVIPQIFRLNPGDDYRPCPFRGQEYQWMRNLVLSRAIAEATHKYPAFAIAYMGPDLPISDYLDSEGWTAFQNLLRRETSPPIAIEIREFVRGAMAIEPSLTKLRGWVDVKFNRVTSALKSNATDK